MMGLLAYREFSVRSGPLARSASAKPMDTWLAVYLGEGNRAGYVHIQDENEPRHGADGRRTNLDAELALNLMGDTARVILIGHAWRAYAQPHAEFEFNVNTGHYNFRAEGSLKEGRLDARLHSAGEILPISVPIDSDLMISSAVGASLNIPELEVGAIYELDTFDPLTFSTGKARIQCVGKERMDIAGDRHLASVLKMTASGVTTQAWVSAEGEILKVETPVGFTLVKVTPEEALEPAEVTTAADLIREIKVDTTGEKPFRGARRMFVELSGAQLHDELPSDETQRRVQGGRLHIIAQEPPAGTTEPPDNDAMADYLKSEVLVQSDHPAIVEAARSIVNGEAGTWARSLRIYEYVYNEIEKVPAWSVPSALAVLAAKEGDCNEHTVLFTALARAANVPTRIAIGVVWSEDYEGFYYHAWPEVYANGWIPMDPTLGQPVADATHIKLLTGGIEKWPQLYPYLGQLKINVMEVQ